MKRKISLSVLMPILVLSLCSAQSFSYDIRLNQVGFLPNSIKRAAVINSLADSFEIKSADLSSAVYKGGFLPEAYWPASEENVKIADFTLLKTPGTYVVVVDDLGKSVPFTIKDNVFTPLSKASIKAFYFNRASTALLSEHAGIYARAAGHPDTAVVVHPSAASATRPAGTILSTPNGWYDAGDYNKYIVNSGISTFTLLSAYETYPSYFDTLSLNIPESGNAIPDILDEALWNIRWMMTMQDTTDGGVYHKTTEASFSSFSMPAMVTATRYVTAKSTAATLDFAALMAMTARIYKDYLPELADEALKQSKKAWQWAKDHPNVSFRNPSASDGYPAISTGAYGDGTFSDEFAWCAAELYVTTKEVQYYNEFNLENSTFDVPGWGNVRTLGLLSLVVNRKSLTAEADTVLAQSKLIDLIVGARNNTVTSPYRIPGDYFYWGGNGAYANRGMILMQAFKLTEDVSYFNAAVSTLDYLLGRNATQYCFVTGIGTKHPMHIHHRISGSDGIAEPIPGFIAGGPNPGNVSDDCGASSYPSLLPAKAYADLLCSYSTNEVAINWNAPLAFLAGAVQYEYLENFVDSMPVYFIISSNDITFPFKSGFYYKLVIEGNTTWSLSTDADWIGLTTAAGTGSAMLQAYNKTDNPGDSARYGKIYIYNNGILTDSIVVSQNGVRRSFRIEAEDYAGMVGLQTESTTDEGGGLNLGYVDIGDLVTYNIDISYEGEYLVVFRHAGYEGDFDVSIDGEFVQHITLPATSGWQDWTSDTVLIGFTEGQHELKFTFNKNGLNLNWMNFDWYSELQGVDPILNDNDISVYPVPADQLLYIKTDGSQGITGIRLISMDGRILMNRDIHGVDHASIDISGIDKGMYILVVNSGSASYRKKVLLK
ncbi:MAG: glycoside hydrolase family 9 protein [Bacteroidales bacterium]|nr:glycoside hydrolase family 9 protein [Bacteroidales bacterium]